MRPHEDTAGPLIYSDRPTLLIVVQRVFLNMRAHFLQLKTHTSIHRVKMISYLILKRSVYRFSSTRWKARAPQYRVTRSLPTTYSCDNHSLFKIHSLNVLPNSPLTDGCQPGHFELPWQSPTHAAESQISPADCGSEASVRGDLQCDHEWQPREETKVRKKEEEEEEQSGERKE